MAGGEGSRLRPLTCDIPKPMVPVMNRPVMEYSVELLRKYGIENIGITLQYLPQKIQDYFLNGAKWGVNFEYFIEETPLGTAGSVKNAQDFLDETFIVISGDGLTNINLKKAIDFHKKNNSIATLILKRVEVPLEYGVVVTDNDSRITRFLEKPNWSQVFSDTVNTGIYILEPEVLNYFKSDEKFDFSQDLFPMLLEDGRPMYGYITDEYWCDIGNPNSYLTAHYDILDGVSGIQWNKNDQKGKKHIGSNNEIDPSAVIEGPCYIGDYNYIGKDVYIGPYTVLGDYNTLNKGCSIKKSIIWSYSNIGKNSAIRGASICEKVNIGDGVSIYEGAVIGKECNINNKVTIAPGIKIWPNKDVQENVVVNSNVVWGSSVDKSLFGKNGVTGAVNTNLNTQFVTRLGASFGAYLKPGKRVVVSSDGSNANDMLQYGITAGLLSSGIEVYLLKNVTLPVLRYVVRRFELDGGAHIFSAIDNPAYSNIAFIDSQGIYLPPSAERKIENLFFRGDFPIQPWNRLHKATTLSDINLFYIRDILDNSDVSAIAEKNFRILLSTETDFIFSMANKVLTELNCTIQKCQRQDIPKMLKNGEYAMGAILDNGGEDIELYDDKGVKLKNEMLLVLKSFICLKSGATSTIVLPYNAPTIIDDMAKDYRVDVIRAKVTRQSVMEEMVKGDQKCNKAFSLYFDNIFLISQCLEIMAKENKRLSDILENMPKFYMMEKAIECPWTEKGKVMRTLIEEQTKNNSDMELFEGVKVNHKGGWALVLPDSDEAVCKIYTQAFSEEYAKELTDFYEKKINQIKSQ